MSEEKQTMDTTQLKSNLIVNYIPGSVDETQLRRLFQNYGTLENVKLVRDRDTGGSMGYGFVKFEKDSEAVVAIANLNGIAIQDKTLKVSVARPVGSVVDQNTKLKSGLFVGGLPEDWQKQELSDFFSSQGTVTECRILMDKEDGKSRGCGFVRLSTADEAEAAIRSLDGSKPQGSDNPIQVKNWQPVFKPDKAGPNASYAPYKGERKTSRFNPMGNRGFQQQQQPVQFQQNAYQPYGQLQQQPQYGQVQTSLLGQQQPPQQQQQQQSPYGQPQQQQSPYGQPQQQQQQSPYGQPQQQQSPYGQPQQQATGQPPMGNPNGQQFSLFVFHLPPVVTEDELADLFSLYNTVSVSSVKVVRDDSGNPKGFAFVNYTSWNDAQSAVEALNGHSFKGKYLKVTHKK